uniref:ATP synthase F0 subunit 6 n=1 Tax=Aeolothrips xinjiangensis TaxID=2942826 RepID=UPI0020298722|nr:ATP synthase F0 subunit 6 [Aeolothrips xinjiangensis]UQJ77466.1 ATP synthase F0 subunit 6 [Aeolothrips xinjiangensis]
MDLFSTFDPQTTLLGVRTALNWSSATLGIAFMPVGYWLRLNRYYKIFWKAILFISNELKIIMKGEKYGSYHMFVSLFLMILMNNLLGMFPFIFTATSHMVFTLTFSISLWISFMIFGWVNFTNSMFAHMVPNGTPAILMPFMVCIETISNVIRSGTLAIRLSANMISGHLLLTLMGEKGPHLSLMWCMILIVSQIILMTLEFSVSIIQSYVFSVLSALYSGESVGEK